LEHPSDAAVDAARAGTDSAIDDAEAFVGLAITVIVEAITGFTRWKSRRALNGLTIGAARHAPSTRPDAARQDRKRIVDEVVAVVVETIARLRDRHSGYARLWDAAQAGHDAPTASADAASHRRKSFVGIAVTVVVEAVAQLGAGLPGNARGLVGILTGSHSPLAGSHAALALTEIVVDEAITIVVFAVAAFDARPDIALAGEIGVDAGVIHRAPRNAEPAFAELRYAAGEFEIGRARRGSSRVPAPCVGPVWNDAEAPALEAFLALLAIRVAEANETSVADGLSVNALSFFAVEAQSAVGVG
jgi:hypothetical protein